MMKKKTKVFWLTAAALVFLAGAAVPPAMAYFTTYVEAEGGYPITLGNETTIEEKLKIWRSISYLQIQEKVIALSE